LALSFTPTPPATDPFATALLLAQGGTLGAILGALRWRVIRRHLKHPAWWIVVSVGAWALAFAIPLRGQAGIASSMPVVTVVGIAAMTLLGMGALFGALSAIGLLVLARRRAPSTHRGPRGSLRIGYFLAASRVAN
jgi:hypothetical protein